MSFDPVSLGSPRTANAQRTEPLGDYGACPTFPTRGHRWDGWLADMAFNLTT
jgi:hypothetical protein